LAGKRFKVKINPDEIVIRLDSDSNQIVDSLTLKRNAYLDYKPFIEITGEQTVEANLSPDLASSIQRSQLLVAGSDGKAKQQLHLYIFDYEGPYTNSASEGCSLACLDFPTLEAAQFACDQEFTCNAITYAQKSEGGANSHGATDG
jgi:hypothetical protein